MKRSLSLALVIVFSLMALSSCFASLKTSAKPSGENRYLYLVVGFDEAAENTDVIFTAAFDKNENSAYFVQIPRDTYCKTGTSQNKINQIYSQQRSKGLSRKDAMKYLTDTLSSLLGVEFDGYVGITTTAFHNVVDAMGGVDIELSRDMTISLDESDKLTLKEGKNHIDGKDAEKLVRYRKGYAMGDLSRIDAQKLFLNAVLRKVASGISLQLVFSVLKELDTDILTNINLRKMISIALSSLKAEGMPKTTYVTIPGEPIFASNNISYYVLNRKNAAEIVKVRMFGSKAFDPQGSFTNSDEPGFDNIYNDPNAYYKEYFDDDIGGIEIK